MACSILCWSGDGLLGLRPPAPGRGSLLPELRRLGGPAGRARGPGRVDSGPAGLQTPPRPVEILAGTPTPAPAANSFSNGRRRRIRAKGFNPALDAYPVEGLSTRSARRTIPFVGRTNE